MRAGDSFGEYALITNKPRSATVKCTENTHFAVLEKQDYQKVYGRLQEDKMNFKIDVLKKVP